MCIGLALRDGARLRGCFWRTRDRARASTSVISLRLHLKYACGNLYYSHLYDMGEVRLRKAILLAKMAQGKDGKVRIPTQLNLNADPWPALGFIRHLKRLQTSGSGSALWSFRGLNRLGHTVVTSVPSLVTCEPVVYLAVMLHVHCGWHHSMTQADGTASTLRVVLFVMKEKQSTANSKLTFLLGSVIHMLMFVWQNQVPWPRLLPVRQGNRVLH